MSAPTQEEILARLRAHPATQELIETLLNKGLELDCDVVQDRRGGTDWLFISTEVCAHCGLPNTATGALVNERDRIKLWAFCKDCTAGIEDEDETVN